MKHLTVYGKPAIYTNIKHRLLAVFMISTLTASIASAQTTDRGIHLSGDTVSMPFKVYLYFPFTDATINGVKGKLMFDTGAQTALEIDDQVVPLKNGVTTGHGFVGSGQSFETKRYDTVQNVGFAGQLAFNQAGPVTGHDFSYMKNITSDILGLVGYNFFKGYLFKLDYKTGRITFYKNTPGRENSKDFLQGEKLIGTLNFETRKLPNHPVIPIITQGDTLAVSFDTGQIGTLALTDSLKNKWISKGALNIPEGSNLADVRSLELPGGIQTTPGKQALRSPKSAAAANKSIGITEPNGITLGYSFLSQYKTVWDFDHKKIYLLER